MTKANPLVTRSCLPCKNGTPPLSIEELSSLFSQLKKGWQIVDNHYLEKEYHFPNFATALVFTNEIGSIAEKEGHHPDIYLSYGKVKISIWTHKINGLTESDFILAAKCDELI